MNWCKKPEDITFQVTVHQLASLGLTCLPKEDIYVTICIGNISKITCSGKLSSNHKKVVWNHPFLFSAPLTTSVQISIWLLSDEPTYEWNKKSLGNQIVTNVANLLGYDNIWEGDITGFSTDSAKISITCKKTNALIIVDDHDCLVALQMFAQKLYNFQRWSIEIEVQQTILDFCPVHHANHTSILNDLGLTYLLSYDQNGNLADLNKAIKICQKRLILCPLEHPEHKRALKGLIIVLQEHYKIQKNNKDLNKIMDMQQDLLNLCPPGDPDHASALGSFAISLQMRFDVQGDITDLNRAIQMKEKRLELCPEGHPDHDTALNNLAASINSYYKKLGNLTDLERDINLQEKCLELCQPGHPDHGLTLQNLGLSLWDYYDKIKNYSDLSRANSLFRQALKTYSVYHSNFAFNVSQLAQTTLLLSKIIKKSHNSDQSFELYSVDEAFETYRLLKKCDQTVSLELLKATQAWIRNAEKYNHFSVLEAYQTSLKILDHFIFLSSSLDSKYQALQAMGTYVVNDAFSCAIRHSNLQMAIELLEQGQGIIWNQLAHFNISMVKLENFDIQNHELGRRFIQLCEDLREYALNTMDESIKPYWQVQQEWQCVINTICGLDGFSQFLLPPNFDNLQKVAEYGPVIIVNASQYGCNALIVVQTCLPINVPLCCSLNDIIQLCSQLSTLTQNPHAYGAQREFHVKKILYQLWSFVVEPIAAVLQYNIQLPLGSRVFWCPTAKLGFLPFHAAGPYEKGKENFMDIYVSSYTPSLSALLRTQDNICHQKKAFNISQAQDVISFAAISQAHPSPEIYMGHIPEVEHEIWRICNETNMPSTVKFKTLSGPAASIEGTMQAFQDHHWVHIACNSVQDVTNPFDSWFAMGDGKLSLMRIIQEHHTNSEFAFLSACHTAKGNMSMPDEMLHFAAGMQFSGFNGVIGTLWRIDHSMTHQVVTQFYKEMFRYANVDFRHAASALNTAVIATANEVPLEQRIVFVHIGI